MSLRLPRTQRALALAGSLFLLGALAACSATGDPDLPDEGTVDEVRVVATSLGDVEVPVDIERPVALSLQQASMMISLGVTPVAVAGNLEAHASPWLEEEVGPFIDESLEDAAYAISPEAVAATNPDVIFIGGWQLTDDEMLSRLQAIAPVVTTNSEEFVPAWQETMQTVGDAFGLRVEADEMISEIETEYRQLGEDSGVVGMTYQNFAMDSEKLTSINGLVLQLTGMIPGPHQDIEGSVSTYEISLEQVPELTADLVTIWNYGTRSTEEIPGFSQLPSVQAGNFHALTQVDITAITAPEPIGLQGHLLEVLTPKLKALGESRDGN